MELLFADLDRATTPSGQKDPVSGLDRDGSDVAVLVASTGTHSDDGGFRERRLGGRRREEDTRGSFGLGLESLDEDSVEQRLESLDVLEGSGHCGCFW